MSQGVIIKALSGFYYIESDGIIYQTRARGVFRKRGQSPLVGDVVELKDYRCIQSSWLLRPIC